MLVKIKLDLESNAFCRYVNCTESKGFGCSTGQFNKCGLVCVLRKGSVHMIEQEWLLCLSLLVRNGTALLRVTVPTSQPTVVYL